MQDVELGIKGEPKGDGGDTEDDGGREACRQVLAQMKGNLVNGEALVVALNVKEVGICDMCLTEAKFYSVLGEGGGGELLFRGRFKPESEGGDGGI